MLFFTYTRSGLTAILLLGIFLVSGCDAFGDGDNNDDVDGPKLEGVYTFSAPVDSAPEDEAYSFDPSVDFELSIRQLGTDLSGIPGTLSFEARYLPSRRIVVGIDVTSEITGSHDHPNVSLTIMTEETEANPVVDGIPITFPEESYSFEGEANFDASRVPGVLTAPDGNEHSVVMQRQ